MAWVGTAVAAVGVVGSVVNGINAQNAADRMANASAAERARLEAEIAAFEKNRQAIINPYASFTNLSGLAKDLSGMISNPYANLGVATQAAKFEAEEIDLSLANTLDTLRETGSSAGGATALAMAALKSKQGISASIEQQEAQNEKLRAQGQQQLDQMKMAEAQRIQNLQITEAQRLQQAGAAGKQFMWESQEERDKVKLDRLSGLSDFAANQEAQANSDSMAAMTGMIGGITSSLAAGASAYAAGGSGGGGDDSWDEFAMYEDSDRRLKKNIKNIGISPTGINIYSFEYKDQNLGKGIFQGVMSDEIPLKAIIKGDNGYDKVNYSMLDVEFKQIQ
jgi:hypothetical protein